MATKTPGLAARVRQWAASLLGRKPQARDAYKATEVNRLSDDWITSIMHPDDEMRWNIRRLRSRMRELARNNPFARSYLIALGVNVLGTGPVLQASVRDNSGELNKRINERIEAAWAEWSESPTVDGKLTLTRFQYQVLKGVARDGEAFVRMHTGFDGNRFKFALESIDPDQLDELYNVPAKGGNNEIRLGVEVDGYGRPVAYHFSSTPERVNQMVKRERVRIPAEEILHLYDPERVNQTRGVPWAATVMWPLKMLEGYMESEAVAARTGAAKMGFWTRKVDEPTVGEIATNPGSGTLTMEAAPGTFDFGPDGYELQTWDAKHPNTAYAEFVKAKLREVASGLGMSYNALANDLEGVNYSSIRSGLLIERDLWRTLQDWWIAAFLKRVYRQWIDVALLSGALTLDSRDFRKFQAVQWAPRGWAWVDPLKDTTAGIAGIQTGLISRRRLLAEQGLDFETILEELAEETKLAALYGVEIGGPPTPAAPGDSAAADDEAPAPKKNGDGKKNGRLHAYNLTR